MCLLSRLFVALRESGRASLSVQGQTAMKREQQPKSNQFFPKPTAAPRGSAAPLALPASAARPRSFFMSAEPKPPVYPRLDGTPSITPGHGLYVSLLQHRAVDCLLRSKTMLRLKRLKREGEGRGECTRSVCGGGGGT